ncbi:helicase-associated domain-containing protein [Actinophytocola oryzae]|uniref:XPB/Ssl2-like helicase family protein n=1 Tax=Actinophytocola oryzae TaxID=502181 RepID=A0A4R7V695_9PSEU|nr:helicase-associated domain-containing protein [Actinophytocola oryzae]TDV44959.1 XPB/Ssl2-like helicase family protein [Actinophytocola oryzae]
MSFAVYLSTLDNEALVALLAARSDVRVEPVPRGFSQLAQRLSGPGSIVAALHRLNQDTLAVGQAVAVLGESATVSAVARLLDVPERAVRAEVDVLFGVGLAWPDAGVVRLPDDLHNHWTADIGGGPPVAKLAATVLVDDLRDAVAAHGVAAAGKRKSELVAALSEALADPRRLATVMGELPAPARLRLEELRLGQSGIMFGFVDTRSRRSDPTELLVRAGLVLRTNRQPQVPREVAVAAWLAENASGLTGRPEIAAATVPAARVRTAAQAAARETVRALSTLLDEAGRTPVAALKKGGVGPRERGKLAKRLSIGDDVVPLWIDIAYAAGLLGEVPDGYAPTGAYAAWRDAPPSHQWAVATAAWHELEHAPLMRDIDDDRELPPPLPLMSMAGGMRRAVLRAAGDGLSVRGAGAAVDWLCPLHGYPPEARDEKLAATVREAELLGVVADDRVSELGAALLAGTDVDDVVADIARRCAPLLPETPCGVTLQSDLTAVVAGQPTVAVARLLAAVAVNETRGDAAVWRFTPASVRAALDTGWTARELLEELAGVADRAVPQPLEYLVTDTARRHGHVRVRAARSCVVADEALVAEILHTQSLAKLGFAQLAPTVLSSLAEPDRVLASLRAAGMAPVAEDESGAIVVERDEEHQADTEVGVRSRTRVSAFDLAGSLAADPKGEHAPKSDTVALLAKLNSRLDDAELALLSHAVDHQEDVLIAYRDKNGSRTIREIRPTQIYGRWLDSYCHLRGADREFTIANIESVAPPR